MSGASENRSSSGGWGVVIVVVGLLLVLPCLLGVVAVAGLAFFLGVRSEPVPVMTAPVTMPTSDFTAPKASELPDLSAPLSPDFAPGNEIAPPPADGLPPAPPFPPLPDVK
ncbi:MAG: hypothetical protein SFU86_19330 [Pirellulaceae bacterium]|nr:hypothetical protein [Pirellulaceae bacterium]